MTSERQPQDVALVTGGAAGLGRAFIGAFRDAGYRVAACDLSAEIETVADLGLVADVSDPEAVRRVVSTTTERFGRVDVLVNNAGIARATRAGHDWERGLQDYEEVVGTNFRGAFLFGRAVAPIMIEQGSGHIVNISTDHIYPTPGQPVWGHGGMDLYNASKWALNGLTLDWAASLKRFGVRVNGLCMGATDTPMLRAFAAATGAGSATDLETAMQPEEIAALLLELIDEGPDGRSGHNLGAWVGRPIRLDDSIEAGHRR